MKNPFIKSGFLSKKTKNKEQDKSIKNVFNEFEDDRINKEETIKHTLKKSKNKNDNSKKEEIMRVPIIKMGKMRKKVNNNMEQKLAEIKKHINSDYLIFIKKVPQHSVDRRKCLLKN